MHFFEIRYCIPCGMPCSGGDNVPLIINSSILIIPNELITCGPRGSIIIRAMFNAIAFHLSFVSVKLRLNIPGDQ